MALIVFVGMVGLALVYFDLFGLAIGAVAWLITYGFIHIIGRGLLRYIGDGSEISRIERGG